MAVAAIPSLDINNRTAPVTPTIRIEFRTPDFFQLPPKAVAMEEPEQAGRVYFIHKGSIVAVARRSIDTDARS